MRQLSHDPVVGCSKPNGIVALPFADLLTDLYAKKYTGRVLLHFHNGIPRIVEIAHVQHRLIAPPIVT